MTRPTTNRVLMLLSGNWETDSRVKREARALAQAGLDVHIVSDSGVSAPSPIHSEGVTYHHLPVISGRRLVLTFPKMLANHLLVQWRAAMAATRRKDYREAILIVGQLALMSPLIVASLLFGLILLTPAFLLKLAMTATANGIAAILRPFLSKQTAGHAKLLTVYASAMQSFAWVNRKLWAATYRAMEVGDFDSIQYLNQFSARAFSISRDLRPDVVHAHDLVTLSCGYAVARATGAPLIYDAHELETHTNYWSLSSRNRRWIAFYEKSLCHEAKAVITVCESIADWLRDHYKIARPIVVHNSPDFSQAPSYEGERTLRAALRLERAVPLCVYVGSITIDRGIEQCVQALAFTPEIHMAFVGPRYVETEKKIHKLAQELDIASRIHLVDPVPSGMVPHFLSDADCSVVTIQNVCLSYYFCFPNKLLESVFAGVPVVVARLIELERFVERFKVGVIADETDPRAIAEAMRTIIKNREGFQPDATTREEIASIYGWPAQSAKLLELYARIMHHHSKIPGI